MATKTIDEFAEVSSPDSVDELLLWSVAASAHRKAKLANLFGNYDVGIGTNTPDAPLHVKRDAAAAVAAVRLLVENDHQSSVLQLDYNNGDGSVAYSKNGVIQFVHGVDTSDGDKFKMGHTTQNTPSGITTPAVTIDSSDNVVISGDLYSAQSTSWTPTLSGTTGITYGTRNGAFKRLGNVVWFSFRVSVTGFNAAASAVTIALPTGTALTGGAAAAAGNDEVFYDTLALRWEATASAFTLMTYSAGAGWVPAEWDVGGFDSSGFVLYGGGLYFV